MAKPKHTVERITGELREARVGLGQGQSVGEVVRRLGITENTLYRWRREYGGPKLDQPRRLKDLEAENARLKRAVAELILDKQILKGAAGPWPKAA